MGTYPRWPASRFLARMAGRPEAREEVARIAGKIETSNVLVHEDLADAALRLSPALSAGLVPGLVRGLGPASTSLLPSKLGALAEGLARSGQVAAARRLLGALLVHARVHPLRVSRVLDRHLEGIVAGLGADALLVIGQALDRTIRLSRPGRPEKRKAGQRYLQDHSDVWSPGLQGDAREGAKGRLIATLRGVAERLVEENPAAIQSVVELLERRRWWVFHRLALHVLGRSAWAAPDLVVGRLLDRGLFDGFGREYRLMVRRGFGSLTAAQQSEWLGWIDAGPDLTRRWPTSSAGAGSGGASPRWPARCPTSGTSVRPGWCGSSARLLSLKGQSRARPSPWDGRALCPRRSSGRCRSRSWSASSSRGGPRRWTRGCSLRGSPSASRESWPRTLGASPSGPCGSATSSRPASEPFSPASTRRSVRSGPSSGGLCSSWGNGSPSGRSSARSPDGTGGRIPAGAGRAALSRGS